MRTGRRAVTLRNNELSRLRAALAAAEAKLESYKGPLQHVYYADHVLAMKAKADEVASLATALADERRDHDTAIKVLTELRYNDSASACWCPSDQNCDSPLWCRRAREVIAAHAARRAHDSECESEFDSQVHAQTQRGVAAAIRARGEGGKA